MYNPDAYKNTSQSYDINERDIELDNLKTIIVALNQKVKSKEELEKLFKDTKNQLKHISEGREDLRI